MARIKISFLLRILGIGMLALSSRLSVAMVEDKLYIKFQALPTDIQERIQLFLVRSHFPYLRTFIPPIIDELLTELDAKITTASCSYNGKIILTGADDGTVRKFDLRNPLFKDDVELFNHTDPISIVLISADGTQGLFVSGTSCYLGDAFNKNQLPRIVVTHENAITGVEATPSFDWIVTYGQDTTAQLCFIGRGPDSIIRYPLSGHPGSIATAVLSDDGSKVIIGSQSIMRLWVRSETGLSSYDLPDAYPYHYASLVVTISGDGCWAVISAPFPKLWDLRPTPPVAVASLTRYLPQSCVARLSSDGSRLITGSEGYSCVLSSLKTLPNIEFWEFAGYGQTVVSLATTADCCTALVISFNERDDDGQKLQLVDLTDQLKTRSWMLDTSKLYLSKVLISRDGKRALGISPRGILQVWDLAPYENVSMQILQSFIMAKQLDKSN